MKYAWIEGGRIRDVASGDPAANYHPDVARLYSACVPDSASNGDAWDGARLTRPEPARKTAAEPPPQEARGYTLEFTADEPALFALLGSLLALARKA